MINRLLVIIVTGLLLLVNSCSCKTVVNEANEIDKIIDKLAEEPIEIFNNWDIWKRSDGYVFDHIDNEFRIFIMNNPDGELIYKEIFPEKDSIFYSIKNMDARLKNYSFRSKDIVEKVIVFKRLNTEFVRSVPEYHIILFSMEKYTILFSQNAADIREIKEFNQYIKQNTNWYYYKKE